MARAAMTWKRAVADELSRCYAPGRRFSLTDFYRKSEDRLQAMYPANTAVRDTMRQVMQRLRDEGLLEFHGRGEYTYRGLNLNRSGPRAWGSPDLAQAAYELAARITDETQGAAREYLVIARADDPGSALHRLILAGQASPTFLTLHRAHRLDLSFENLVLEQGDRLGLERPLLVAASDRLAYFNQDDP